MKEYEENKILKIKNKYKANNIEKYQYLDKMNDFHNNLFFYMDLIKDSCGRKIEITKDNVIFELETGIRLYCIQNDKGLIPYAILNFGEYEEKLWQKTAKLIENPKIILDIGGNIGYFSLFFANIFKEAKIYCFEPIPRSYEYIVKNLSLNKTLSKNILPFNIGLTNKKEQKEMYFNPEGSGSSSLQNLLEASCTYKIFCEFSTLDKFVEENSIDNIDFIKCDVEGAEKFVFEGGLKTIKRNRPLIYTEMLRKWSAKFNYHPNDIINLLKQFDYNCYAISKDTLYLIDKVTNDTTETNFIFTQGKINKL